MKFESKLKKRRFKGIVESYLTDEKEQIKNIVISLSDFKKIEELILNYGLGKAMNEIENEEGYDLETAKSLVK